MTVWIKQSCADEPLPESVCSERYNDCAVAVKDMFGQNCRVVNALPDGWAYERENNSVVFYGEAVPPFGSIVEVAYTIAEEH